jgi:16S rRNA processing protein RimM
MANLSTSSESLDQPGLPADDQPGLPAGYVRVGNVVGTHGNDGRLRVDPETDNPERFAKGSTLTIDGAPYTVSYVTFAAGGNVLLVNLNELSTREQAQALVKQLVLVATDDTPALPEDTYYHYQLLDMTVVDPTGVELGTLTEVITTGANDVYVVTAEGSELMIPALADVVVDVDIANARMTVDVPEGIEPRSTIPKPKNKPPRKRFARPKRPSSGQANGPAASA